MCTYNGILLNHKNECNNAMNLEIIILREVRQRKTNIIYHLYVESKKNELIYKTDSQKANKTYGYQSGEEIRDLGLTDTLY